MDNVQQAKKRLHELVVNTKCYVKEVAVLPHKIDCILLDRLEKVRKVMETNGSYVLFPALGSQRGVIRVQGTEILHVERTVREIMALVGYGFSRTHSSFLTMCRLVNSTVRLGGCCIKIWVNRTPASLRRLTSALCSPISVPTLVPT